MTGDVGAMVKKTLKVVRAGSGEGIMGNTRYQWAEELKYCGEVGALWRRDNTW